jgi:hypothetical protein
VGPGVGRSHLELWVHDAFAHSVDVVERILSRAEWHKRVQLADLAKLRQILDGRLHVRCGGDDDTRVREHVTRGGDDDAEVCLCVCVWGGGIRQRADLAPSRHPQHMTP